MTFLDGFCETLQCLWNIGVFLRDSGVKFDPEILPLIPNHSNSTSFYVNCVCYNDWKRVKDCVSVISHTRSAESYCQIWRCSSLFLPDPGNDFFSLCSRPHSSDSDLCEKHTSCHTWTHTNTDSYAHTTHSGSPDVCVLPSVLRLNRLDATRALVWSRSKESSEIKHKTK